MSNKNKIEAEEQQEVEQDDKMSVIEMKDNAVKTTVLKDKVTDDKGGSDGCLVRLSGKINSALSNAFRSVGFWVGSKPWLTILLCIILSMAAGSAVFYRFETEDDPDKLFAPEGVRALDDKADLVANYGVEPRFVSLIVTTNSDPIDNILTKDNLVAGLEFYNEASTQNVTVESDTNSPYTLEDLCLQIEIFPGFSQCLVSSIYQAWAYNIDVLKAEPDDAAVRATLKATFPEQQLESLVGGVEYDANGLLVSGKALRFAILLENNSTDGAPDLPAEAWETALIELTQGEADGEREWDEVVIVYPQTTVGFGEEVGGAIQGDVIYQSGSYFIIIAYVIFVLQRNCDRVHGSVAIALGGVTTVGLGIVSAFGTALYAGKKYGNTHGVLPFIVLGLAADSVFILTNAFRRTKYTDSLAERSGEALSHAGVSLTVSALTNVVAFAIGSLTVIPDLSSFSVYASLSLFYLWIYSCTFFMAILVINERRIDQNKLDVFCCLPACRNNERTQEIRPKEFQPTWLSRKMKTVYTPLILSNWFRTIVLVGTVGWVSFSAYMITQLSVESTGINFIPDDSYLKNLFDIQAEFFGGAPTDVDVVIKEFNYQDKAELFQVGEKFRFPDTFETEAPRIIPTFEYFLEEFVLDLELRAAGNGTTTYPIVVSEVPVDPQVGGGRRFPNTEATFYQYLNAWLNDANGGGRFSGDIVFTDDTNTEISRARIRMEHTPIGFPDEDGIFKEDANEIVKVMDKMYEIADAFSFDVYPYGFTYSGDWASFAVIAQELWRNIGLCLCAVLVVVTLLIGEPLAAFLVFMMVVITIVELLGANAILGLAVDTVVVVLAVLSLGISVDYSAHNCLSFMLETGTRAERVAAMLEDVAVPVLHGATSTLLAVVLQAFSQSYVFRVVFYEFLFTVGFAALNGLILLPVLLSLIGPAPYKNK